MEIGKLCADFEVISESAKWCLVRISGDIPIVERTPEKFHGGGGFRYEWDAFNNDAKYIVAQK